jgi:predicted exporter
LLSERFMTQHVYRRWCSVALLILTLVSLFCFWSISRAGLQIDTNLRSLSPSFSVDASVNQALNKMSADAAQQFILVLVHEDEDRLADASDYLRELIEQEAQVIRYIDHSALLDAYAAQLKQHSFHILGPQAQEVLAQGADESILKLGENNLYGSGGSPRPFGVRQ